MHFSFLSPPFPERMMTKTGDSRNEPLVACTNGRSGLKTQRTALSFQQDPERGIACFADG
jgi:hypothetical protein